MSAKQTHVLIGALGTAVLVALAHAQTPPPTPRFGITKYPALYFNVWPGDFNEDGRTDLVAGLLASDLVISIGGGDGTFGPPRSLRIAGMPLNVGDFNGDGLTDVLIARLNSIEILPGRGDGTFRAARVVDVVAGLVADPRSWALATDFNGDGTRDVLVADYGGGVHIYPGNGDFTFGPRTTLQAIPTPVDAISRDFNGDGRRDIALADLAREVTVMINQGGLVFTRTDLLTGAHGDASDITAGDLNRDGHPDLIVASSSGVVGFYEQGAPSEVSVLLGNGDGTFRQSVNYETGVRGAVSVVVGDFNRDGMLDVATGNRSLYEDDNFGRQLWDSISVLSGDGHGRLLTGANYSLSRLNPASDAGHPRPIDLTYFGTHHQLNTSDLNGDHQTDLIASPGVILINRPAAPNRAPSTFAGADHFVPDADIWPLMGEGTDPDGDWLTYTWTNESGETIGRAPWILRGVGPQGATRTFTLTVEDGHGGRASDSITIRVRTQDDPLIQLGGPNEPSLRLPVGVPFTVTWREETAVNSYSLSYSIDGGRTFRDVPGCSNLPPSAHTCTWTNPGPISDHARLRLVAPDAGGDWIDVSSIFSIVPRPPAPGWLNEDVGAVGARGRAAYSNGTWTVAGSGADIWNWADEFHYVYRQLTGNFVATARVVSVENLHRWVKAGIMVRENLSPASRHAIVLATPGTERGIAFQRRVFSYDVSHHTAGPALAPPVWLKLTRAGNTVSAFYRQNQTDSWTPVGQQTFNALPSSVYIGLAVSSHVDGALATATFDHFTLAPF
jgi:hypothetical protein